MKQIRQNIDMYLIQVEEGDINGIHCPILYSFIFDKFYSGSFYLIMVLSYFSKCKYCCIGASELPINIDPKWMGTLSILAQYHFV